MLNGSNLKDYEIESNTIIKLIEKKKGGKKGKEKRENRRAIGGVMQAISKSPPALSKEHLHKESDSNLMKSDAKDNKLGSLQKARKLKTMEALKINQSAEHVLSVELNNGEITKNLPALSKEHLNKESEVPLSNLMKSDAKDNKLGSLHALQKARKFKTMETVNVNQSAKYVLSVELNNLEITKNPPAFSKEQVNKESTDQLSKLKKSDAKKIKLGSLHALQKARKLKTMEKVNVNQSAKYLLSVELNNEEITKNPPALSKEQVNKESTDQLSKLKKSDAKKIKLGSLQTLQKARKLKTMEMVNINQSAEHMPSVKQQLNYEEITEACVGLDESRKADTLQALACDPGLDQMLPRLCAFIEERVRVNIDQEHNLAELTSLMRMVLNLLKNKRLRLEKYMNQLIRVVGACIIAGQLCSRPEEDNHWALRDFASRLMSNICKKFTTSTDNDVQARVTRVLSEKLADKSAPLASYYGAIAGLQELGPETIKTFVLPNIKALSARLLIQMKDPNQSDLPDAETIAVNHIVNVLVKSVCPLLKHMRPSLDKVEDFIDEFGVAGFYLHNPFEPTNPMKPANPMERANLCPWMIVGCNQCPFRTDRLMKLAWHFKECHP
jgi:hypothetical protein